MNPIFEVEDVTVKISEMKLWVTTKNNPAPRHRFRLSVHNFFGKRMFYETIVTSGCYEVFELKETAELCILKVLKRMNPDLIVQSIENRKKFERFISEFEDELTRKLEEEPPLLCQLF